jgi:hypothetical protein
VNGSRLKRLRREQRKNEARREFISFFFLSLNMAKLELVSVFAFLATIFIVLGAAAFVGGESGGGVLFISIGLLFGVLWVVSFYRAVK